MNITDQIHETQNIMKESGIYGCITGSSWIDADFDEWDEVPDIDLFTYTQNAFVQAVTMLLYRYHYEFISEGEEWKYNRTIQHGMQKDAPLITVKLSNKERPDVYVNVTYHKRETALIDVLSNFDMSIVMQGYDMHSKKHIDMRNIAGVPNNVAVPNPLRCQDFEQYNVQQWIRQFDRVVKYWNRGLDTRPMARFYLEAIDKVLETGALFPSENAISKFNELKEEFEPAREKIASWLADKEDC